MLWRLPILLTLTLAACADAAPGDPGPSDLDLYLEDGAFRRQVLEDALWRPELPYSKSLLNNYGLVESGWDLLPEMPVEVEALSRADAEALAAGEPLRLDAPEVLETAPPADAQGWQALGEQVFSRLPMRGDRYLDWALSQPELWEALGFRERSDGSLQGLVKYRDFRREVAVAMTCSTCHLGDGVLGRGDRELDLGAVRAGYLEARGGDGERFRGWGPGRVDVTDDGVDTPTTIPDLHGMANAAWMNHSGVISVTSPATLAVRFETQYILGHRMMSRPPRVLTRALAELVLSLDPPAADPSALASEAGEAEFQARCASCHDPARAYGGDLVAVEALTSDPAVAETPERGTGFYKIPSLLGVRERAPYLHDGSAATLREVLAGGHPHGVAPDEDVQDALIDFLTTL